MENGKERRGSYFSRIDGKELKRAREVAKKCSVIIDKIQQYIGKDIGSATFSYDDRLIECSFGKQFDYYYGRILTAIETRPGDIHWRRITTLHDNQKEFPFTQYEENLYSNKPRITSEIDEDSQFNLEGELNKFSTEVDQWKPIT